MQLPGLGPRDRARTGHDLAVRYIPAAPPSLQEVRDAIDDMPKGVVHIEDATAHHCTSRCVWG